MTYISKTTFGLISLAIVLSIVSLVVALRLSQSTQTKLGDAGASLVFYQPGTNTSVACGNASSTLLLATSTGSRTYFRISNVGGHDEYISFGANATAQNGLWLQASTSYDLGQNSVVFAGSLYCTAVGGVSTTSVVSIP